MIEEQLTSLEEDLGIELPDVYREFLSMYPDRLRATPAASFEVQSDPTKIVAMNKLIDASHIEGWRDTFLAIGESGCGDYYAIDLDENDGEVYFWNHETAEVDDSEGFPSILEFAGYFLRMYQNLIAAGRIGEDAT